MRNILMCFTLIFSISFFACHKSANIVDDENTEIDDSNDLTEDLKEGENIELETRASKIVWSVQNPVTDVGEFATSKIVPSGSCLKYGGYFILPQNEGSTYKITGSGFGVSGSLTAYITKQTSWKSYKVVSWSDTAVVFSVDSLPMVRNVVMKVSVKNGLTQKSRGISMRCVGANGYISASVSKSGKREYITYPSNRWEANYQLSLLGKSTQNLEQYMITPSYVPQIGDVLVHDGNYNLTVITEASTTLNSKGEKKYKAKCRNYDCAGRIKSKTYYAKNGYFPPKTGETAFASYLR